MRWMVLTFKLILLLKGVVAVDADCTSVSELSGLNLRSIKNNVTASGYHIKDGELAETWYSVVTSSGDVYRMSSTSEDGMPDLGRCGTRNPIYIEGSLPKLAEGKEISTKACFMTWDSNCATKLDIKLRLCSGKPQYYLPAPQGISAYCFEPEERQAPPNYVLPSKPRVIPGMSYQKMDRQDRIFKVPQLEFTCDIQHDPRWFYLVQWFARVGHDDKIIQTFELSKNLTSTKLLEDRLTKNNIDLGTTILCAVSVASAINGATTVPRFSDSFFAGIKVLTPTITIFKGRYGTVRLQQTVPIGCVDINGDPCLVKISLYNVNQSYQCPESAVAVTNGIYCGTKLHTWNYTICSNGCPRFSTKQFELRVTTKQTISYRMKNTFEILLKTEDVGVSHGIWKNYTIARTHVNVAEDYTWARKSCHSTADPQFNTFDGRFYYPSKHEDLGEYLLYENTENGIQVQYKTYRCAWRGTCTCGVVVRAGGDLWMYTTCNNADYIGFLSCKDGLLVEEQVTQTSYKIHTPSGTYVRIQMHSRESYLDIDVYPSPADLDNTRGHCGTLNGDSTDDVAKPDGSLISRSGYGAQIDDFYESWRVPVTLNYFNKSNLNPPSWNRTQLSCVCSESEGLKFEVLCSADTTAVCYTTNDHPVCNSRRKRSTYRHRKNLDRVFAKLNSPAQFQFDRSVRSADNVSYDEAYVKCLEFFTNKRTYSLKDSVPDAKLNASLRSCAFDATIDITKSSWISSHFESWNRNIENEIKRNITYREKHPAEMSRYEALRCSDDCNGQGTCLKGLCQCDDGYSGSTCFIQKAAVLAISDIEGGGECDVKGDDQCHDCLQIKTRYLLHDFKCNVTVLEMDNNGLSRLTDQFQNGGEYENVFEGRCCPRAGYARRRRSVTSPGSFVTKYLISVSNDGVHFGPSRHVYVYDSTCQKYTVMPSGDYLFSLKKDSCFIDGKCHFKGHRKTRDSCNTCWPDKSLYEWSEGCSNIKRIKEGEGEAGVSGNNVTLIVAITVSGLVVFGLTALVVIWKLKRPAPNQNDAPPAYMDMPRNKRFVRGGHVSPMPPESPISSVSAMAPQVESPYYSTIKA